MKSGDLRDARSDGSVTSRRRSFKSSPGRSTAHQPSARKRAKAVQRKQQASVIAALTPASGTGTRGLPGSRSVHSETTAHAGVNAKRLNYIAAEIELPFGDDPNDSMPREPLVIWNPGYR